MKKTILLALGFGAAFVVARLLRTSSSRNFDRRSLPRDTSDFVDLNQASNHELSELGLDQTLVNLVVENRPYRNKLDLMSRLIIPEDVYESIRHRIGVREAYEPVKVA